MAFPKPIIAILSAALLLVWATPSNFSSHAATEAVPESAGRNHALIVGIGDYQNWPKLESPVQDAEKLARLLVERYDFRKNRVSLITDKTAEKPTLVNLLSRIERYREELTEEDNLLIFFSGHGTEDDEGATYWIPLDGKKNSRLSWLSHQAIIEGVFASEAFRAKNLCILTDSVFSNKLLRNRSVSLTPYDLRYKEKILEKSAVPSREIISFGDQHWPASAETDDMGLFAFYLYKALSDNPLDVIDFENLLFDENILFPITKIAGTRLLRGRLQSPMARGGQFVIRKIAPAPVIDVLSAEVTPQKGYPGEGFVIRAKTSAPADEVVVDFEGKRLPMSGENTQWYHRLTVDEIGSFPFRVAAVNRNAEEGKAARGRFFTVKPQAPAAHVIEVAVTPAQGVGGDEFEFTARTGAPAEAVTLQLGEQRFTMEGSGTRWRLRRVVDRTGRVDYTVSALNVDGVEGSTGAGTLTVRAGRADIVSVEASPKTGYAGEEFTVVARTDRPAAAVALQIDGQTIPMSGSGRAWSVKKKVSEVGRLEFTAVARNTEGVEGKPGSGVLIAEKTPLPIPDVTSVEVSAAEPGKGYAGDRFTVSARTSAPSEAVFLELGGEVYSMKGGDTTWQAVAEVGQIGKVPYRVVAQNQDGMKGQSRQGHIVTEKRPAAPVNVLIAEATPNKGVIGQQFVFRALTDRPSSSVVLQIGKERYEMEGSGSEWILETGVKESGEIDYSLIARNEDNKPGQPYTGQISVFQERYRLNDDGTLTDRISGRQQERFVDNKDGTITDRATSLMWLQQPKQIATNWDDAVEYCRKLDFTGRSGWRLPTIGELEKLVDESRQNPALPENHPFSNVITHVGYWSKTRHRFGPRYVYQMSLWYGRSGHLKKEENAIVWPVRFVDLSQ